MAKFCGNIGFIKTVEIEPGVWSPDTVERKYYGDVTRNSRNFSSSEAVNESMNINNIISIVADPYAKENFQYMRYVIFMGIKWEILSATIEYPRITLSIGGVYNGK